MPHIRLPDGVPGIGGPMQAYPETAGHLRGLANALLQTSVSLTPGERETIAAAVSAGNECVFCARSHAAVARRHLGEQGELVDRVLAGDPSAPISPRLRALLAIAAKVRVDGRSVTAEDVQRAREAGADDRAIHDTVLIAAAFCMYNRYVDGLGTWAPDDAGMYTQMGARLAEHGYLPMSSS
ncbi:MAG: carboxymuconolactone decarboxylase family protein [Gemmatimonadales bacterium]